MSTVDVGPVEDFPDGTMKVVDVDGTEIGICRWGDEVFAMRSRCPHQAAPLCLGWLQKGLSSRFEPGDADPEVESEPDEPTILCPWHRWEFSVRTGESAFDPNYRVRTYDVTIDDGHVHVQIGRN